MAVTVNRQWRMVFTEREPVMGEPVHRVTGRTKRLAGAVTMTYDWR
ncbi:MAG: hypothetical protein ABR540_01775 [Acidimicrobiales bacterium]